ncbi:MAG: protein kinase domain-containing protein [Polyangiales bacterium]
MSDPYLNKTVAGEFRILEQIGAGGMGAVYKAEQPAMGRFVAIKVLHAQYANRADLVSRFRREARAMSQLTHPNTAQVFMSGQLEDGSFYFAMEFLQGRNLADIVRAEGPLDPVRAIQIMVPICGALEEAHRAGIIHRDLKPENIVLTHQGGLRDFPKLLDFGLAKVSPQQMRPGSQILTQRGMVFGTPEFMSPEQAQGEPLDARSDIYSLALVLYEALTGKLPFDAETSMDYLPLQIKAEPIALSVRAAGKSFPPGLQAVLSRALQKVPLDRYQSMAEMGAALSQCISDEAAKSAPPAQPARAGAASPAPQAPLAQSPTLSPPGPTGQSALLWLALGAVLGVSLMALAALLSNWLDR